MVWASMMIADHVQQNHLVLEDQCTCSKLYKTLIMGPGEPMVEVIKLQQPRSTHAPTTRVFQVFTSKRRYAALPASLRIMEVLRIALKNPCILIRHRRFRPSVPTEDPITDLKGRGGEAGGGDGRVGTSVDTWDALCV